MMLQNGQDFACQDAAGVFVCTPSTPNAHNIYAQLQTELQKAGAAIPAIDGLVTPSTALAAQEIVARLAHTTPPPLELMFLVVPGAAPADTIKLVAANAQPIMLYMANVLAKHPDALHQASPPPPPLAAPFALPFTLKTAAIVGGGVAVLGGLIAATYKAGKRACGTADGRNFLPPDDDEDESDES